MSDSIDKQKVLATLDFADNALTDEDRTVEKYKELLTECIKVLPSAESKGDLISRQVAIDAFERFIHELGIKDEPYNYGEMALSARNVPSVENKGEWIPVSERLPEMGVRVLCACQADLYDVLKLTPKGWFYDTRHTYMFGFVRAWMPLPEPYKAER